MFWRLFLLFEMMLISDLYSVYKEYPNVSTDTRNLKENTFFFCLKGERFNGNTFSAEALEKGAAYVVVDEPQYRVDDRCILVDNVLETLQQLAMYHRSQLKIPVIGITGTNGKTTTKELVTAVLSKKYRVVATQGNLNNHIGVPLTLLSIRPDTEIAVVEMGANHPHEIAGLCQISQPDFGLITNIGKAHLEGFGDVETIVSTKTALYESVRGKKGCLFVNADDALLMQHSELSDRITYGTAEFADVRGQLIPSAMQMCFSDLTDNKIVQTKLVGNYNFPNAMAALAIGKHFDVNPDDCRIALESYEPGNGRSQIIQKGNLQIVLDAYNANPTSMSLAIRNMAQISAKCKILVLGDMRELGQFSLQEHQRIVDLIRDLHFEHTFLLGEEFSKTNAPDDWKFPTLNELQIALNKLLSQSVSATLLIKGSRGMKMEQILEFI